MVNEAGNNAGIERDDEGEQPDDDAYQAAREFLRIMDALLAEAARSPSPALRQEALAAWSDMQADLWLIRSLMLEKFVRAAYVADDPEARRSVRSMLVQLGVASPLDFERHSCPELLAALPTRLAALGIGGPGQVG